jgi:dipeptidase E
VLIFKKKKAMKRMIFAVGGGRTQKTLAIDQEIIKASGKQRPRLLFVPTASGDSKEYAELMEAHFSSLGAECQTLYIAKGTLDIERAHKAIAEADIIYVGGGNTLKMMNRWRRLGIDSALNAARERGAILCGVSAGSICWFSCGNSDSRKSINPDADYILVTGLGFVDALHCPHFDSEADRRASLMRMVKKTGRVAIALDDCVALQVVHDKYRIIRSSDTAQAYKIYWNGTDCIQECITDHDDYRSLQALLAKQ